MGKTPRLPLIKCGNCGSGRVCVRRSDCLRCLVCGSVGEPLKVGEQPRRRGWDQVDRDAAREAKAIKRMRNDLDGDAERRQ